jgi:hypothetical protein
VVDKGHAVVYTGAATRTKGGAMKQYKEHVYTIEVDDNDHSIRKYFLDDQPVEYVDPSKVKVGAMVYWDHNNRHMGIVMANNRRDAFFQLYDIFNVQSEKVEEVTEFQVFAIAGE